jgi:hypothetical protein
MAPQVLLRLALLIVETACQCGLQQGDTTQLVRLMELIKRQVDLNDPEFEAALASKLQSPGAAELLQLWLLAGLASRQPHGFQGGTVGRSGG